jgi:hypothetical protein
MMRGSAVERDYGRSSARKRSESRNLSPRYATARVTVKIAAKIRTSMGHLF